MRVPTLLATIVIASASLTACSAPASVSRDTDASKTSADEGAHNWTVHQDGAYGYPAAFASERNAVAAARVIMFRYLGRVDSEYEIGSEDALGTIAACANPCTRVRYIQEGETVQRVALDPQSPIGLAFKDAVNGQLEVSQLQAPKMEQLTVSAPSAVPDPQPPLGADDESAAERPTLPAASTQQDRGF
jgi:hypothetical protein